MPLTEEARFIGREGGREGNVLGLLASGGGEG